MTGHNCWGRSVETPVHRGSRGVAARRFRAPRPHEGQRSHPPRAGVSLLEVLVVMTTLSVLLTTCTVTLMRLLRAQSASGGALAASLTISRLARDLRRDAHTAAAAAWDGPVAGEAIELTDGNGGRVRYALSTEGVRRTTTPADGRVAVDDYLFPAAKVEWELAESGLLVVVRISRSSPSSRGETGTSPLAALPPERLVIEAAVGRAVKTISAEERE